MKMELKPDYDNSKKRYDAFWEREIIDRPPVSIILPVDNPQLLPPKKYASQKERWLDVEYRAKEMAISLENRHYYGDALPIAWPNMGPEIFSAWSGCDYHFGETTTWSDPCIDDWEKDTDQTVFNAEHPLFKTTMKFTEKLLELGKDRFIVGLTDFHPGGDHLAALRDPQQLAIDMIENLEYVKRKLEESQKEFFEVYDIFYQKLRAAGMPITSWTPLIHDGRYYIPSNDFSCMVSEDMFNEVFLPGIVEECNFYERSIYHLDGPGALRHLDSLLSIEKLDAVQWVPGAGNEGFERWLNVYQKIQKAGKAMQIVSIDIDELSSLFNNLNPEGIFISHINGIDNYKDAEKVLQRLKNWK